jgi:hypothetical protein
LPLKESKQETIAKIPRTIRHRTYSSSKQPEIGKTRVIASLLQPALSFARNIHRTIAASQSAIANPLPSFALWQAFPTSDYYDGSDASISPRWTTHLNILIEASHVHVDGLYDIV